MQQKRIALLACSNGMGHAKRMLALAFALREAGARPVLLAERSKVVRLAQAHALEVPELVEFASRTERSDWMGESGRPWIADLPPLDGYDEVVSDNLVEILERRPDAYLSGSFFWHRALDGFPTTRSKHAQSLLQRHRPRMISSALFSSPYLAGNTRLTEVGLYALPGRVASRGGGDVLVACGTGGGAGDQAYRLFQDIAAGPRPPCGKVWVEPSMFQESMPDWMQVATFTPAMYAGLLCAVIRPGVGTATDALLAGARIFSFYEADNDEMRVNASRLVSAGVGEDCGTALNAWRGALQFMSNTRAQTQHRMATQALDREGANQAASFILNGQAGLQGV